MIISSFTLTRGETMSDTGKGDIHTYHGFTQSKLDAVLASLRANGAQVSGSNPWDVDTNKHGIKLRGTWAPTTGELQIIVIDKNFYVSYAKIWETLDDLLNHVGTLVAEDGVCPEYV